MSWASETVTDNWNIRHPYLWCYVHYIFGFEISERQLQKIKHRIGMVAYCFRLPFLYIAFLWWSKFVQQLVSRNTHVCGFDQYDRKVVNIWQRRYLRYSKDYYGVRPSSTCNRQQAISSEVEVVKHAKHKKRIEISRSLDEPVAERGSLPRRQSCLQTPPPSGQNWYKFGDSWIE